MLVSLCKCKCREDDGLLLLDDGRTKFAELKKCRNLLSKSNCRN